jgi:Tfp pilus assembly protein PilO
MLVALVFLVASLLIFFDLIEPAYGNLQMEKGQQLSDQQFLSSEQDTVAKAQQLLTDYQNDMKDEANLSLAMPSGPDVAGGLAQIYGIAAASGIAVQTIDISSPAVQVPPVQPGSTPLTASQIVKPIGNITFQIAGTGSYEAFKAFLATLETNIRIFDLASLSMQPLLSTQTSKSAVNADLFTYNISATTYYQLP